MAPSPRKRATATAFNQTWDDSDAAFLDTGALPLAKIPRGWERKQEKKKLAEGKEKSIWRRFNLLARNTAPAEEDESDEEDARSRAVKRRQRMSPKAMEKSHGNKRLFKATRWDRRKSVLPRKNAVYTDNPAAEEAGESSEEDTTDADMGNASFSTVDTQPEQTAQDNAGLDFTFSADATSVDELPDYESMDEDDQRPSDDVTFAHIFRSPVKGVSATPSKSPAKVEYPHLPPNDDQSAIQESEDASIVETIEVAESETTTTETGDLAYPALSDPDDTNADSEDEESEELSEVVLEGHSTETQDGVEAEASADEEFTEASLQLNIQREYESAYDDVEPAPARSPFSPTKNKRKDDITNGLTLSFTPSKAPSAEHTPRKMHSPPPPLRLETGPEDATTTIALDDDTAILKSFLSRAAASKAEKAASITRRESLENRRDSDIVRHALASPTKILQDKDPNSPSKFDKDTTADLCETPPLEKAEDVSPTPEQTEAEDKSEQKPARASRRSARAKTSRLPAPAAAAAPAQASKIAIRRADGSEHVVLKKSDAQELALITRNNTRKNKQGAFTVTLRLLKLATEAIVEPLLGDDTPKERAPGKKSLRWDEQLAYYQEHADTIASQLAEAESLSTPDELSLPAAPSTKSRTSKDNSTPKIRRVRGLGTANGTPGKGLLTPASLLPESVQKEAEPPASKSLPKPAPRPTKMKKPTPTSTAPAASPKLAALEVTPVGIEPAKERKSRLATPKKVKLSTTVTATAVPAPVEGKENAKTTTATATATKAAAARPGPLKKSIPAPKVYTPAAPAAAVPVAAVGVESGLPRRRGRKA